MLNYRFLLLCWLFLVPITTFADTPIGNNSTFNLNFSLRTSVGASKGGETELAFKAPGAVTKFRLGNEADNNLKLAFEYRRFLDGQLTRDKKHIKLVFMLEGYDIQGNDVDANFSGLAQGYLSFNNFAGQGSQVWVGRRWYDRVSIYMLDHFWLNTGQRARAGAGIEGLSFGDMQLDIAFLMSEDHAVRIPTTQAEPQESVNSTAIDLRLKNIATNTSGHLNLWAYGNYRPTNIEANLQSDNGLGLAVWHVQNWGQSGSRNRAHIMFREGTAVSRNGFNPNPILNNGELQGVKYLEFANDFLASVNSNWDVAFVALYRKTQEMPKPQPVNTAALNNQPIENTRTVFTIGLRPQYALSEHLSIVSEFGHDRVKREGQKGNLNKLTIALQLQAKKGYWDRPAIRAFVTAAKWSDAFKGKVGGPQFLSDTSGFSVGIQAEWWWYKG